MALENFWIKIRTVLTSDRRSDRVSNKNC